MQDDCPWFVLDIPCSAVEYKFDNLLKHGSHTAMRPSTLEADPITMGGGTTQRLFLQGEQKCSLGGHMLSDQLLT
jgi:hypothetical protein